MDKTVNFTLSSKLNLNNSIQYPKHMVPAQTVGNKSKCLGFHHTPANRSTSILKVDHTQHFEVDNSFKRFLFQSCECDTLISKLILGVKS